VIPGTSARVVLVGREGCHLCEDAREVVQQVCTVLDVPWTEVSLDDDPDLPDRYDDLIPVVLVDGREHAHWRVDAAALRKALLAPPDR
jgi:hypothetical protein